MLGAASQVEPSELKHHRRGQLGRERLQRSDSLRIAPQDVAPDPGAVMAALGVAG